MTIRYEDLEIEVLQESFAALAPHGEELIENFYESLFSRHPGVKPLFRGVDMATQKNQLLKSLVFTVENLKRPEHLVRKLVPMGKRHQNYGAEPAHYGAVAQTLIDCMAELAGDLWTPELEKAWETALGFVAQTLLSGYEESEKSVENKESAMTSAADGLGAEIFSDLPIACFAVNGVGKVTAWNNAMAELTGTSAREMMGKKTWTAFFKKRAATPIDEALSEGDTIEEPFEFDGPNGHVSVLFKAVPSLDDDDEPTGAVGTLLPQSSNDTLKWAVEGASNAMITIDRDLVITYVNPATVNLIRDNYSAFRAAYPGVNFDKMVGTCVDIFHKVPSRQRSILNDPSNMPHQADIQVGDLTFSLNVSAAFNAAGDYVGNTLEWSNVTEDREMQDRGARLHSAIEGSGTSVITVNRDLVINYVNPASTRMINENINDFRASFPGFDVNDLMGSCVDRFHTNPAYQRSILNDPSNLPYSADIKVGKLTFRLNVSAMRDAEGKYIGNNLEWANVTEVRARDLRATSLESMIEGCATNLMMCDMDLRITYMNHAVRGLLNTHRVKLSEVFPGFDPDRLVGRCIDDFHVNPAKQRSVLLDPRQMPYKTEIKVLDLEFGLNATPLMDVKGKQIGAAVEWIDYNDRARYRDEVNQVIAAATGGDLNRRGNLNSLSEVYRPMMQGINTLIEAIVAPIGELRDKLQQVSAGDLTAYVTGAYEGDHALLKKALNTTLDSLNDILSQVNATSEQVNTGASQVSEASQSLSQGATEQAAALEEITASMTEMASQTKQNAENATQANQLAIESKKGAEAGNHQMEEMVVAMKAIDESSKNISKIIKVIDEIAFQTNLLALNAAVEAARAGVHGKGFAVVAEEVRNLAARSANAAKETTALIEESIAKVNQGTEIADKTATALNEIVSSIGKVTDLVAEIAAASNEQAQGIAQTNKALGQMDQVTQQNTANAEESAAASQELSNQAGNLQRMLTKFKLSRKESDVKGGGGIPPEMLAAFQRFMAQQGGAPPPPQLPPHNRHQPYGGYGMKPPGSPSGPRPLQRRGSDLSLDPTDMINLDDDEFGRY